MDEERETEETRQRRAASPRVRPEEEDRKSPVPAEDRMGAAAGP